MQKSVDDIFKIHWNDVLDYMNSFRVTFQEFILYCNVTFMILMAQIAVLNPFLANVLILSRLKAPENLSYSGVFRG